MRCSNPAAPVAAQSPINQKASVVSTAVLLYADLLQHLASPLHLNCDRLDLARTSTFHNVYLLDPPPRPSDISINNRLRCLATDVLQIVQQYAETIQQQRRLRLGVYKNLRSRSCRGSHEAVRTRTTIAGFGDNDSVLSRRASRPRSRRLG